MDRRVVVGLVGIALAGAARESLAQTAPGRDPSAQPSVALEPLPSIGDSINNTTTYSGVVPLAPSAAPTGPAQASGRDAKVPKSPISPTPVSMTPIEPIHRSINRGFGTGLFGSMFRRPATPTPSAPRTSLRTGQPPKVDAMASPSSMPASPAEALDMSTPNLARAGRPAPYAGRSPETPRPQADPNGGPAAGRPAPYAQDRPRAARPQAPPSNVPAYRPSATPSTPPERPEPIPVSPEPTPPTTTPVPIPVELPSPPPTLDPIPASPLGGPDPASTPDPVPSQAPPVGPPPAFLDPSPSSSPPIGPPPALVDPVPPQDPPAGPPPVLVDPAPAPTPVEPAPAPSPVDSEVSRTSYRDDNMAARTETDKPRSLPFASIRAAAVGDEIITMNELINAVNDQMKDTIGAQQAQMSQEELKQVKNQVAASVLNRMIDQALILQQTRKMMSNPKAKQSFDEFIEKQWKTDEVPPLLRRTASANVAELKVKLASEGKSYEQMKEAYRKKLLSNEFLRSQIHNKVTADMIELRLYYGKHLDQFEMPARMTWREVEINVARYPSRAAARQKAEEVQARLLRDEDFDAVARSVSNGPTASKGGVYVDMQPGSYGIPIVNDELNRLPIGQVSQVLEAPNSFHVIRVDSRREKGPLHFEEVQDKIRAQVLEENFRRAVEDYLVKLRAKTLIRTMFDKTASDPELARRNDPNVRQAANR